MSSLIRNTPAGLPGRDSRGGEPSYCHVVEDPVSGLIFTAGQIGVDAEGKLVGEGQMEQFAEILRHFDLILDDLGLDRSAIMKATIFTIDVQGFYADGGIEAFGEYFAGNPPAPTLVGVAELARPEFKLEVEIVISRS